MIFEEGDREGVCDRVAKPVVVKSRTREEVLNCHCGMGIKGGEGV